MFLSIGIPTLSLSQIEPNTLITKWQNLSQSTKGELLAKDVYFLGERKPLFEIAAGISETEFSKILGETLNGSILIQLATEPSFEIATCNIPKTLPYYILRSLSGRTVLRSDVFNIQSPDIFLIRDIDRSTLSGFAKGDLTELSSNQLTSITARLVKLMQADHFDEMCKVAKVPIHQLAYKNGILSWEKSCGSSGFLTGFVSGEYESIDEEKLFETRFSSHDASVICILGGPGSGKSTLISNLSRKVNWKYPERLTIFYFANDFMTKFKPLQGNLTRVSVGEVLADDLSSNILGFHILKMLLISPYNKVELFVDAVDELSSTDLSAIIQILNKMRKFNNFRILITITTANYFETPEIGTILRPILYQIQPLYASSPLQLLTDYWVTMDSGRNENLKLFAETILKHCLKNLDNETDEIAGVPLQCYLIANVYLQEAKQISYGKPLPNGESKNEFSVGTIFKLYQAFMRVATAESHINETTKLLTKAAIQLMFPMSDTNSLFPAFSKLEKEVGYMQNTKYILQLSASNYGPRFVHRTFAEYFIASYLVEILQNDSCNLHCLCRLVFETTQNGKFCYKSLCYFFNEFILNLGFLQHQLHPKSAHIPEFSKAEQKLRLINACAHHNFYGIYCYLARTKVDFLADEIFTMPAWYNLLLTATKYSDIKLVKSIVDSCQRPGDIKCSLEQLAHEKNGWEFCNIQLTPLHIAAQRGCYQLVEYFIHLYSELPNKLAGLLHVTVSGSYYQSNQVAHEKIDIIELFFAAAGKRILEEQIEQKLTPILMDQIHLYLIEHLVNSGANITAACANHFNVAHKAIKYMDATTYGKLVALLAGDGGSKVFTMKNCYDETPMQKALSCLKLSPETIKLFVNITENNLEQETVYWDSLLYHVIKNGYEEETLEIVMENSSLSRWKGLKYWDGSTTAVHQAAYFGNIKALLYFLKIGADPNQLDSNGASALHMACKMQSNSANLSSRTTQTVIDILVEHGANVNLMDKQGCTPFWYILNSQ